MAESIVKVILTGDTKGLHRALDGATKDMEHAGKSAGTAGGSIKAGLAVGAGAALAFGVESVKSYMEAEDAETRLRQAIRNSGGDWHAYQKRYEDASKAGQTFGYDQGQIMAVLAQMTTSLGSPNKALADLGLVENVAAQTGKGLSESAMLVTKGLEGQIKPLKAIGLDLPVTTAGAAKLAAAQDKLAKAEDNLKLVEQKVKDGRIPHKAAAEALRTATDKVTTAQATLSKVQGTAKVIQDALTKDTAGAAVAASDTFSGKLATQAAAWRNVKIEAGKAISGGLIKFQTWSQKSGRPEIMRLQGDLTTLGHHLDGLATQVDHMTTKMATMFSNLETNARHAGGAIADAFGLGGDPNGTPGAAQRDRARLDAISGHPHSGGSGGRGAAPSHVTTTSGGAGPRVPTSNVTINVHVHGADPAATVRAIQTQLRRQGVPQ